MKKINITFIITFLFVAIISCVPNEDIEVKQQADQLVETKPEFRENLNLTFEEIGVKKNGKYQLFNSEELKRTWEEELKKQNIDVKLGEFTFQKDDINSPGEDYLILMARSEDEKMTIGTGIALELDPFIVSDTLITIFGEMVICQTNCVAGCLPYYVNITTIQCSGCIVGDIFGNDKCRRKAVSIFNGL